MTDRPISFSKQDRETLRRYIGRSEQLYDVKEYRLVGGRADGMRALDVDNGAGLVFTLLADRGLDILSMRYRGINLGFLSNAGPSSPVYLTGGNQFHDNFYAGLLTTCGLTNVGTACSEEGRSFPTHGRFSGLAAERLAVSVDESGPAPVLSVRGVLREAAFFGGTLELRREVSVVCGENTVTIRDEVENLGFEEEGFELLYHFNLGYPLLDEHSRLVTSKSRVTPRDSDAAAGVTEFAVFEPPVRRYREQVFYHDLAPDGEGRVFARLESPSCGLAAQVDFNKNELSRFTEWKMMGEGCYVLGLEPCNCPVEGRVKARADGLLETIKPGETRHFAVAFSVKELEE